MTRETARGSSDFKESLDSSGPKQTQQRLYDARSMSEFSVVPSGGGLCP
jgi:hypothetical protein